MLPSRCGEPVFGRSIGMHVRYNYVSVECCVERARSVAGHKWSARRTWDTSEEDNFDSPRI